MSNLQVKNVPSDLDKRLHRFAAQEHRSIRDVVLEAVRRELDRRQFVVELGSRTPANLKTAAAKLLSMERQDRGLPT
jgi:plasmid stability protein